MVNQQSTWQGSHKYFGRITSDSVDPGGQSTVNLGRCMKTLEGLPLIACHPQGGSINSQFGKDCHEDWGRISTDSLDPGEG